ncbi:ankyrin repeat domain-containing protein [Dactylosporangium sp. NPDC051541]|uniref:ankyrin repeat domain-containing protein n=1 Tax=Dactylosporangium sp. NPDC051541 TaxID=3363977 RepID=UPI0037A2E9BB
MTFPLSRDELAVWRRIRRYAVPRAMIEAATAARLAGDWRAACAAAGMSVAADADFGPFADDLRHLVPDLVRWHLPRSPGRGETTIDPRLLIVLARRGDRVLGVATPRVAFSTQRLRLVVTYPGDTHYHGERDWSAARHLWDDRETGELVARTCGPDTLARLDLQAAGRTREAWAAAGVEVPEPRIERPYDFQERYVRRAFDTLDVDPAAVVAAAWASGRPASSIALTFLDLRLHTVNGGPARAEWVDGVTADDTARMPVAPFLRPVDLHLVRHGRIYPADLHPLIGPLLEPFFQAAGVPAAGDPTVRVRCGGDWHVLGWDGGRMRMPHSDGERQREDVLRALGGEVHGCFAAEVAWADRSFRLPRRLEEQRRDLLLRMLHGDLAAVVARLDAGVDPRARDAHGRTLAHLLPCVDWRPGWPALLSRLLAAGLDLEARDATGRTPLHSAVHDDGSEELIQALLAAGADPRSSDDHGQSIREDFEQLRGEPFPA